MDDDLGPRLLSAVARLNRWASRQAGVSASVAAWRLLAAIEELGPSRIGELARVDNCSQPTVTGQVRRLEDAGWVRREPDPDDARAVLIALTPAGAANLQGVRAARSEVLAPRLAELTDGAAADPGRRGGRPRTAGRAGVRPRASALIPEGV